MRVDATAYTNCPSWPRSRVNTASHRWSSRVSNSPPVARRSGYSSLTPRWGGCHDGTIQRPPRPPGSCAQYRGDGTSLPDTALSSLGPPAVRLAEQENRAYDRGERPATTQPDGKAHE